MLAVALFNFIKAKSKESLYSNYQIIKEIIIYVLELDVQPEIQKLRQKMRQRTVDSLRQK